MKKILLLLLTPLLFIACDENTDYIGTTLTDDADRLYVFADTFDITASTIVLDSVLARSTTGYLGRIADPETGTHVTANFMAQYGILEDYLFPDADSIVSRSEGKIIADSCEIRLFCNSFFGDSLAVMKLRLSEMSTPMQEATPYYSSFSPQQEGMLRTGGLTTTKTYTLANQAVSNAEKYSDNYVNYIHIPLNQPYTDKRGRQYNNYGTYLLTNYYETPAFYRNSYQFIHNIAPGFFYQWAGGLGSMAYITNSQINVYFRYQFNDSTYQGILTFAATDEVLQTTNISNDKSLLQQLANNTDYTYLKTPAALITQLTLPIDEILAAHENDTINSAKITLQRANNISTNHYTLNTSQTLLLIPADSVTAFFENNRIADNKMSFLSSFNSSKTTTQDANTYAFDNIGTIITGLANKKREGLAADPQWLQKHPNWNKVVVVPVTATYVNTTTANTGQTVKRLYRVRHDMSLSSTRLLNHGMKVCIVYSRI